MNIIKTQRKDYNYILTVCMPCRLYSHNVFIIHISQCAFIYLLSYSTNAFCATLYALHTQRWQQYSLTNSLYALIYIKYVHIYSVSDACVFCDVSNNSVVSGFSKSVHRTQIFRYVYDCFMTSQSTHVTLCLAHMEARGLCFVPIQQLFVLTSTV